MLFGAIRLLEYILLIIEQIAWVSRWFELKKYIAKMFLFRHSQSLLLYNVCTTMLTWYNRWMVSFVDTICYVSKIIWQKRNLMIHDNSGIELFKNVIIRAWFSCLLENWIKFLHLWQHMFYDLITNRSRQSCQKNKMWRQRQQFLWFYYNK